MKESLNIHSLEVRSRKPREAFNFPEESKGLLSVLTTGADARLQLKNISQHLPLKLSQINTPNSCLGNSHRNVNWMLMHQKSQLNPKSRNAKNIPEVHRNIQGQNTIKNWEQMGRSKEQAGAITTNRNATPRGSKTPCNTEKHRETQKDRETPCNAE